MLCPVLLAQLLIESEFYESTPATKALKLAAKPGELYGLEISSGFNDWVTVKEWYGLGQEVQQNLFAGSNTTGPANGDSNYSDPAISLLVEPGVGGTGLVVSWRSLDNGSAQQVYLASSTLHPNWPTVDLQERRRASLFHPQEPYTHNGQSPRNHSCKLLGRDDAFGLPK